MDKQELYVYSTEDYLRVGKIKVGQCRLGWHKKRIKQQFGTANLESPKTLWVQELPDDITDRRIHNQFIKNGCQRIEYAADREWFHVKNKKDPVADVMNIIFFPDYAGLPY